MEKTETKAEIGALKIAAGVEPYRNRLNLDEDGSGYLALCPWHEKGGGHTPSLAIFKSKETGEYCFKCLSKCGDKSGDIIKFVQLYENVSFTEAVKIISKETEAAGLGLNPGACSPVTKEHIARAENYLLKRGISAEVARQAKVTAINHPTLGLALKFPYDVNPEVAKFRAIQPKENCKFAHTQGHSSTKLLYNFKAFKQDLWLDFDRPVFVTESECDCLLMKSHGYQAVSVSSASSCIRDGNLTIQAEYLEILAEADFIVLALDMDPTGQRCADAFEKNPMFSPNQISRMTWPWGGKRSGDPKDIGEIYDRNPAEFKATIDKLAYEAMHRPPRWRQQFRTIGEMDERPIISLISGFLYEGNIGIGGLSGSGKTFLALSIAKALTTGKHFVEKFPVPEIKPVLYLCPEVNDRQFKRRAKWFEIPNDQDLFLCRTMSQGTMLGLDDPYVLEAVKQLHDPVVILDTAIRFSKAKDENQAAENRWMEINARTLREAGAVAVILLHHSPKSSVKETPTLENSFRGSTDIGALFDIAYSIRRLTELPGEVVQIECVKPRDFEPPPPFRLGLRYAAGGKTGSFIEDHGDLAFMEYEIPEKPPEQVLFLNTVQNNPNSSYGTLIGIFKANGLTRSKAQIERIGQKLGWSKQGTSPWTKVHEQEFELTF